MSKAGYFFFQIKNETQIFIFNKPNITIYIMNTNNIFSVLLFAYKLHIYVGLAKGRIWYLF